jgi:hypothetical protein
MKQNTIFQLNDRLMELFEMLDQLHTAAADETLPLVTATSQRELIAWLREVIYTAQETVREIDGRPYLRAVETRTELEKGKSA